MLKIITVAALFFLIVPVIACGSPSSIPAVDEAPAATPSQKPSLTATSTVLPPPPPSPANFRVSGLTVSPARINPGEKTTISVTVANIGGMEGNFRTELGINNSAEQAAELDIPAGKTKTLKFSFATDNPGTYEITLGGLTGQLDVINPVTPVNPRNVISNTPSCCPTPAVPIKPAVPSCCR